MSSAAGEHRVFDSTVDQSSDFIGSDLARHLSLDDGMIEEERLDQEEKKLEFIERCRMLGDRWSKDLRSLMDTVPDKDEALDTIISELKRVR